MINLNRTKKWLWKLQEKLAKSDRWYYECLILLHDCDALIDAGKQVIKAHENLVKTKANLERVRVRGWR